MHRGKIKLAVLEEMERHGRERGLPATVTQLSDALSLPVDRVTQALKALVKDEHVEHIARGHYVLRKTQERARRSPG
jgi:Mn-dependent DtxR family transcriptional regulator